MAGGKGKTMTRTMQALGRTLRWRVRAVRATGAMGMTTAEYAVGTLAAVAFAAVLLAVVKSGPVKSALASVITSALGVGS
jgi:hypothetical protein